MHKLKIIAEVSSNHNKDLERCKRFIRVSKKIGCYAIKFQLFKIDQLFHESILKKSKVHRERKKWELPDKFIKPIYDECKKQKIKLGFTPFYLGAIPKLKKYVDFFKISSYEILWTDLLKECAKTKKPIVISTGMATYDEIKKAVKILTKHGSRKITILHCISEYPAKIKNSNLNFIHTLKKKFKMNIGWSDHTRNKIFISYLINKLKINTFELHLDLDKKGYEYKTGHCWLPHEIEEIIKFQQEVSHLSRVKFKHKKISKAEMPERFWRADPQDGLRPFKMIRKKK